MYLMNFLFDFDHKQKGTTVFDGIFSPDRGSGLLKSKNWLKLKNAPEPTPATLATFDPEPACWDDLGEMDLNSIQIGSNVPRDDGIGIRFALDPSGTLIPLGPGGAQLTLAVCFGRPGRALQPRSSPFADAAGAVQTNFVFAASASNRVANGAPVSWYFPIGFIEPSFRPTPPRIDNYGFAIGITVVSGGTTRYFGYDPDMDIT